MKKKIPTPVRYLELNLGNAGGAAERFTPSRFKPDTELETLRILKRASGDKKLRGIFINTSGFSAGREYLWELRSALENCKAKGKKVAAYFDNADLDLYCFLSAADKIIMDLGGILFIPGYSWGRFFVKESLEKLGVGFRELRYLQFKSANETFSRSSISEADREQYGAYLDEIFDLTKNTLIRNRHLSEENFASLLKDGIILSSQEAMKRGLVDSVGREEAIRKTIEGMEFPELAAGAEDAASAMHGSPPEPAAEACQGRGSPPANEAEKIRFITAGNPRFGFFSTDQKVHRYTPEKAGKFNAGEIAVVHAKGNTDLERGMETRNIARIIRELSKKSRVKALVLRVNSPGGSAVAADFIAAAVQEARKKIPVVISLGQVAASGGYWAAMYGSHITASPYTLTGSIGVIGGWFFDKGLNTKLGLGFDALTRGEHADLTTGIILPARDLSEEEEDQYRRTLLDLYDEFVKKAAESRNMKSEDLEKLAQGRVYSGLAAQRLGLIDSLGTYLDALETARKLAEISPEKKLRIREYPKPKFFKNIAARFFSSVIADGQIIGAGTLISSPGRVFFGRHALPAKFHEDLIYRLEHNGQAMPILPLDGDWM